MSLSFLNKFNIEQTNNKIEQLLSDWFWKKIFLFSQTLQNDSNEY